MALEKDEELVLGVEEQAVKLRLSARSMLPGSVGWIARGGAGMIRGEYSSLLQVEPRDYSVLSRN